MSAIGGVMPRTIVGNKGVITPKQIEEALLGENVFFRKTKLICLENPHNRSGGLVIPLKNMEEIYQIAHQHNIFIHLDGARIFNAAVALDVDASVIAKNSDSVMFCLSKGLGVPIGAILSGSKEFIEKARKFRQMLGGVMRQAGVLAASGIIALETMVGRLKEDQENAWILAKGLNKIKGVEVDLETVQTNMVFINVKNLGINSDEFLKILLKFNILASPRRPTEVRFITHFGINREDIDKTIKAVEEIAKK
jgi:threonine aldolase